MKMASILKDKEKDFYEKEKAANTFAKLNAENKSAIPALLSVLPDDSWGEKAARWLAVFGEDIFPDLIAIMKTKNTIAKKNAIMGIFYLKKNAHGAAPELVECLKDTDPRVRKAAIRALYYHPYHWKTSAPVLVDCLSSSNCLIVRFAIETLSNYPDAKEMVDPELFVLLASSNAYIRLDAAYAIMKLNGPNCKSGIELLINHALGKDNLGNSAKSAGSTVSYALYRLRYLGPKARETLPVLKSILSDNNNGTQKGVLEEVIKAIEEN